MVEFVNHKKPKPVITKMHQLDPKVYPQARNAVNAKTRREKNKQKLDALLDENKTLKAQNKKLCQVLQSHGLSVPQEDAFTKLIWRE